MRYIYLLLFSALLSFKLDVQCSYWAAHVQIAEELLFSKAPREVYARDIAPLFEKNKLTIAATVSFLIDCAAPIHCCNWAEESIVEGAKRFQADVNPATLSFSELENVCAGLYVISCSKKIIADTEAVKDDEYYKHRAAAYYKSATELNTLAYTLCGTYCDPFIKKAEESKSAEELYEGIKAVKLLSLLSAKLADSVEKEKVRYYLDQKKDSLAVKSLTASPLTLNDIEILFDLGRLTYEAAQSYAALLDPQQSKDKEFIKKFRDKVCLFAERKCTSLDELTLADIETVSSALWLAISSIEKSAAENQILELKKTALAYYMSEPFKKCLESIYELDDIATIRRGLFVIYQMDNFYEEKDASEKAYITAWQQKFAEKVRSIEEKTLTEKPLATYQARKPKGKGAGSSRAGASSGSSLLSRLLSHKRALLAGSAALIAAGIGGYIAYQKWGTKKPLPKAQK